MKLSAYKPAGKPMSFLDEILIWLKDFEPFGKPKNEEELVKQIAQFLIARAKTLGRTDIKVDVISSVARRGKPDLIISDKVGVEVKIIRSVADRDRLRGQLERYRKDFPYIIAICYDKKGILRKEPLEITDPNVRIIVI